MKTSLLMIVMLAVLLLATCFPPTPESTPPADPTPIPMEELAVPSHEAARDLAVQHVATLHNLDPPAPNTWQASDETPQDLVGLGAFSYRSGDWLVSTQAPVVRPDLAIFRVQVTKGEMLKWQGRIHADGAIEEGWE